MAGDPVQRHIGDVEVHLAGLDLDGTGIDLRGETARSQHCGSCSSVNSAEFTTKQPR